MREIEQIAETERGSITRAATRLRQAGHVVRIVSAGSSPTARHAENMAGVTEIRAGVYMFGDLFQEEIETHGADAIAVTVLASVIGRRPGRILVDAGGLALSKDRSTQATLHDYGYGLALDIDGPQPRPRHRPQRLPGAWRHRARPQLSGGSAHRRQAEDRAQSYLHDGGGA